MISLGLLQVDGESALWKTTNQVSAFHWVQLLLFLAAWLVFTFEQLQVLREAGSSQPLAGLSDFNLCKQTTVFKFENDFHKVGKYYYCICILFIEFNCVFLKGQDKEKHWQKKSKVSASAFLKLALTAN